MLEDMDTIVRTQASMKEAESGAELETLDLKDFKGYVESL